MCLWGTDKSICVLRRNNPDVPDGWHVKGVDACIADYVQVMNCLDIVTTCCCCGHGDYAPEVLVAPESAALMERYGYAYEWYEGRSLLHYIRAPETPKEIDAYLVAHGYDLDKLNRDARALFAAISD